MTPPMQPPAIAAEETAVVYSSGPNELRHKRISYNYEKKVQESVHVSMQLGLVRSF